MAARAEHSKLLTALAAGGAVALVVGVLKLSGVLALWELKTQDLRTRWTLAKEPAPETPPIHPQVLFVMATDESLQRVAEATGGATWPWDRELYAVFIRACTRGKATAVLVDLVLNEPGEGEADLVMALKEAPPTFLDAAFWETGKVRTPPVPRPDEEELLRKFAIDVDNDGSVEVPERYDRVFLPTPNLAKAVTGACDVSTPRDDDGILRQYRLFSRFKDRWYPSMALAALMAREKVSVVRVRNRRVTVGRVSFEVEKDATVGIRYYPPGVSFRWRSAWNVINGMARLEAGEVSSFDPKELEGKVVIFGTNASGLTDLRVTPVSDVMPGAEIHGVVFANLLRGDFLRLAPAWLSILFFVAGALGTAVATRYASAILGAVSAAGVLGVSVGASVGLYEARWIVDLVPTGAAVVLAYAATSAVNFLYEGRQRLRVKREFQRYLSPKVVEKILKNPDALSMAGERKELTIFFMDFAGFTSMSEKLDPAELVTLISEYHHEAAEEIFRTEGTIDKYIGDAIMAFWNDPIEQADHALRACLSAVAAQRRLREMAAQMKERGLPEMRARIGVNTGIATVGNMGAKGQVNYTVIGDEVNLASRLEGVNKEFGTDVIISDATFTPAKDRLEVRELAFIKVKGRKHPVRIFELLGLKGEVAAERLDRARRFEGVLADFRARKFEKALEAFRALAGEGDRAADAYADVCERYAKDPPPADWDGSYQMETK